MSTVAMDDQNTLNELANYNQKLMQYEEHVHKLQQEVQRLQRETIRDNETLLFSTAYFHARLQEEIIRSERYRHFLSLVLVHVEIKDSYSTQQVTEELKRLGRELMAGLARRTDIIAIYRRRQMAIVLPETDPRGAQALIQRYTTMFPNNGRRMVYCTLTYPNDASNIELLLNRLQDLSEDLFRGGTPTGMNNK